MQRKIQAQMYINTVIYINCYVHMIHQSLILLPALENSPLLHRKCLWSECKVHWTANVHVYIGVMESFTHAWNDFIEDKYSMVIGI